MANKKTTAKSKKDDTPVEDDATSTEDATSAAPADADAAYWEQKAGQSKAAQQSDAKSKSVEDYVSNIMVVARPNESSEQLLRRFNREVRDRDIINEIRERLEYEKPSQKRKRLKRERYMASKRRNYN